MFLHCAKLKLQCSIISLLLQNINAMQKYRSDELSHKLLYSLKLQSNNKNALTLKIVFRKIL